MRIIKIIDSGTYRNSILLCIIESVCLKNMIEGNVVFNVVLHVLEGFA